MQALDCRSKHVSPFLERQDIQPSAQRRLCRHAYNPPHGIDRGTMRVKGESACDRLTASQACSWCSHKICRCLVHHAAPSVATRRSTLMDDVRIGSKYADGSQRSSHLLSSDTLSWNVDDQSYDLGVTSAAFPGSIACQHHSRLVMRCHAWSCAARPPPSTGLAPNSKRLPALTHANASCWAGVLSMLRTPRLLDQVTLRHGSLKPRAWPWFLQWVPPVDMA